MAGREFLQRHRDALRVPRCGEIPDWPSVKKRSCSQKQFLPSQLQPFFFGLIKGRGAAYDGHRGLFFLEKLHGHAP